MMLWFFDQSDARISLEQNFWSTMLFFTPTFASHWLESKDTIVSKRLHLSNSPEGEWAQPIPAVGRIMIAPVSPRLNLTTGVKTCKNTIHIDHIAHLTNNINSSKRTSTTVTPFFLKKHFHFSFINVLLKSTYKRACTYDDTFFFILQDKFLPFFSLFELCFRYL